MNHEILSIRQRTLNELNEAREEFARLSQELAALHHCSELVRERLVKLFKIYNDLNKAIERTTNEPTDAVQED